MRKGDATRQRIILEAASIFNRRGYAGCSMRDVMDATGLEKGGLYRHFATKEELAVEAFRLALDLSMKVRVEPLGTTAGALNKLRRAIQIFVEEPSAVEGGCPLMNTAIDADDGNPALRALALEGIRTWRAGLSMIVEQGIQSGEIRNGVEPDRVANTMIATLEGALMISRLERNKNALRDAQNSLESLLGQIVGTVRPFPH